MGWNVKRKIKKNVTSSKRQMEVIRLYDPTSQSPKTKQSLKALIHSNSINKICEYKFYK